MSGGMHLQAGLFTLGEKLGRPYHTGPIHTAQNLPPISESGYAIWLISRKFRLSILDLVTFHCIWPFHANCH
jgi:hypothetical protein